jgi:hypothetical protein
LVFVNKRGQIKGVRVTLNNPFLLFTSKFIN